MNSGHQRFRRVYQPRSACPLATVVKCGRPKARRVKDGLCRKSVLLATIYPDLWPHLFRGKTMRDSPPEILTNFDDDFSGLALPSLLQVPR
ncbi:hypothetical protein QJS10_CPB22g00053 [Acorus calamus]|uniref:Uncharacterized protein n=1 Tax=Acorus calamus TaxID=4465 RepID=A0AAV9C0X5_ACOCL|nr:hypothetical protein QJS10_CPB22g00053 [Acorus calamus]